MYCPNCSIEASIEQKFCRACGMELQAVSELVRGDGPTQKPDRRDQSGFERRQRVMLICGFVTTFGAAAVGAALKLLGKENIRPAGEFTPYLTVLAVLAALFGMGLICFASLGLVSPRRRSKKQSSNTEPIVGPQVEQLPDQSSSITEKTTEFLEGSELRIQVRDTTPDPE